MADSSKEIKLIIQAILNDQQFKDKVSGMSKNLQKTAVQNEKVKKSFEGIQNAAIAVGAAFVGTALALKDVVGEAIKSTKINMQLNAVLKSTGYAAGLSAKEIKGMADALSQTTTFEDDAIVEAQNLLLTFTKIGRDVFPKATETMLDMSQALGQDLKASATQLGKALNEPISGISTLRRIGVQLTDSQEMQIKKFMQMNDLASAQNVILDELGKTFGGSANAAAKDVGVYDRFNNTMGNVKENVGNAINKALVPLTEVAVTILNGFNSLNPVTQGLVGTIGILTPAVIGLAVAFGPIPALVAGLIAASAATAVAVKNIKSLKEIQSGVFMDALDQEKAYQAERVNGSKDTARLIKTLEEELLYAKKKAKELSTINNKTMSKEEIASNESRQKAYAIQIEGTEYAITLAKKKQLQERTDATIKQQEAEKKAREKAKNDYDKEVEKFTSADSQTTDARIENIQRLLKSDKTSTQQRKDLSDALAKAQIDKAKEVSDKIAEYTSQTLGVSLSFYNAYYEERINQINKEYDAAVSAIDNQSAAGQELRSIQQQENQEAYDKMTDREKRKYDLEKQLSAEKEKLEKQKNKKIAEAEREKEIFSRGIATADIGIKTAQAIMSAVTASPLTGGLPWSAIIAALGAAQAAAVWAQPLPEVPQFAQGVTNFSGGPAIVGENGTEGIMLPRGADVIPNRVMRGIGFPSARQAINSVSNMNQNYDNKQFIIHAHGISNMMDALNKLQRTYGKGALK